MSIRLAAFIPISWSGERQQRQNYYGVAYAFQVETLQMLDEPHELEVPVGYSIISIEEGGVPLSEFRHPEKVIYVTGNSEYRRPSEFLETDDAVALEMRVPEDDSYTMYGHQAMAVVLYDRMRKANGAFA